jgi:hypothetical protein
MLSSLRYNPNIGVEALKKISQDCARTGGNTYRHTNLLGSHPKSKVRAISIYTVTTLANTVVTTHVPVRPLLGTLAAEGEARANLVFIATQCPKPVRMPNTFLKDPP